MCVELDLHSWFRKGLRDHERRVTRSKSQFFLKGSLLRIKIQAVRNVVSSRYGDRDDTVGVTA